MKFPILLSFLFFLSACGSDAPAADGTATTAAPENAYGPALSALEDNRPAAEVVTLLLAEFPRVTDPETGLPDRTNSENYVAAATAISDRYPNDTVVADPLYKAAEVARALDDANRAAGIYRTLYDRYGSYSKAPEALFMLGFTYDENLKDFDKARVVYDEFLEKHPDHFFAESAEMMIANLGKTSEELLRDLNVDEQ